MNELMRALACRRRRHLPKWILNHSSSYQYQYRKSRDSSGIGGGWVMVAAAAAAGVPVGGYQ